MSVSRNESTTHTCLCNEDPDLRLWGPDSAEARARSVRRYVREQLAARLPWLRLPREVC